MSGYRPYPAYKPSGVDWLGDVPEHWGVRRLKHTVQLRNEKVEATGEEYNYIGLENIESWTGRLLVSDSPIQPEGLSDSFESGNVLFGKLRPYLAKVYQARSSGTCTSELLVMRPVAVTPRFLYYALLSDQFIRLVDASTYGAKMPRASWNFIGTLPSVVPPFEEQQEISDFLDHETARIDAAIDRYERLIALLGEKRQALISHAVTKGLDSDAPMKDSGVEWLGEVPAHWEVRHLRRVCEFKYGDALATEVRDESGDVPVFGSNGIVGRHTGTNTRGPVLIIGRKGSFGKITYSSIPGFCIDTAYFVDDTCTRADLGWLFYSMQPLRLDSLSQDTGVPGLSRDLAYENRMPLPPPHEQAAIAAFLDRQTAKIDALTAKARQAIELLREHRTSLISAAATGKIDVRQEARIEVAV